MASIQAAPVTMAHGGQYGYQHGFGGFYDPESGEGEGEEGDEQEEPDEQHWTEETSEGVDSHISQSHLDRSPDVEAYEERDGQEEPDGQRWIKKTGEGDDSHISQSHLDRSPDVEAYEERDGQEEPDGQRWIKKTGEGDDSHISQSQLDRSPDVEETDVLEGSSDHVAEEGVAIVAQVADTDIPLTADASKIQDVSMAPMQKVRFGQFSEDDDDGNDLSGMHSGLEDMTSKVERADDLRPQVSFATEATTLSRVDYQPQPRDDEQASGGVNSATLVGTQADLQLSKSDQEESVGMSAVEDVVSYADVPGSDKRQFHHIITKPKTKGTKQESIDLSGSRFALLKSLNVDDDSDVMTMKNPRTEVDRGVEDPMTANELNSRKTADNWSNNRRSKKRGKKSSSAKTKETLPEPENLGDKPTTSRGTTAETIDTDDMKDAVEVNNPVNAAVSESDPRMIKRLHDLGMEIMVKLGDADTSNRFYTDIQSFQTDLIQLLFQVTGAQEVLHNFILPDIQRCIHILRLTDRYLTGQLQKDINVMKKMKGKYVEAVRILHVHVQTIGIRELRSREQIEKRYKALMKLTPENLPADMHEHFQMAVETEDRAIIALRYLQLLTNIELLYNQVGDPSRSPFQHFLAMQNKIPVFPGLVVRELRQDDD
jgi:hypothetical protein